MTWFSEQMNTRRRLDREELEDSYARLAASVTGSGRATRFTLEDATAADTAIDAILSFYGCKHAQVPEDVTDPMERIECSLRPTGIMKRPVRLEGDWWRNATGAYLGKLKDGNLVAILPLGTHGYGYFDPTTKERVRLNRRNAGNLEEEALCFYRPLPARELSTRDVLAYMLRSLAGSDYALMIIATALVTLLGMLPTIAYRLLFNAVIPSGLESLILPIGLLLFGVIFAQALIKVTSNVVTARLMLKLRVQIEAATYARVMLLPPSFFRQLAPGDLAHRVSTISLFVELFSKSILNIGLTCVFALLYVAQIFSFAPALALPALCVAAIQLAAVLLALKSTIQYNRKQMQQKTKLSGVVPALLHGVAKLKIAGAETRAFSFWARRYAQMAQALYGRPSLLLAAPSLIPLVAVAGTIAFYTVAVAGSVSVADYMAFNYAFGMVSGAITALATSIPMLARLKPLLEMVEPIMKAIPETLSNKKQVSTLEGAIEVTNVSFRYASNLPLVLDEVSLKVSPGEYVAIVGTTGCGKSTLLRMLLGFEQPCSGTIAYDGRDLASVDVRSVRRNIGVVMQNGDLFAGDIFGNITIMYPRATLDDAWEAAELAGIADDIRKMPMGMQTLISEGGGGVSGGQRQRLLIARAICGKPRILMLDEATSALDNVTQKHVSDALEKLNCTRIVIAHRLSTIRHADRIIMLDGGTIVEDGTYEELLAHGGKFADLVARQQLDRK
ncbi:MAG: NHLP bacteriocin export ABC transporter permease/ATPase subunit [Eggerthellaceae bacterium]|nr:NHLP bacteriocin export ABC transporter permease/ATPase subunit [Eggerthellaceae bacterium]